MTEPLISYAELWILFLATLVVFAATCAVLVLADGIRVHRAQRARAARVAQQQRADVAGRKANAESARWVG